MAAQLRCRLSPSTWRVLYLCINCPPPNRESLHHTPHPLPPTREALLCINPRLRETLITFLELHSPRVTEDNFSICSRSPPCSTYSPKSKHNSILMDNGEAVALPLPFLLSFTGSRCRP